MILWYAITMNRLTYINAAKIWSISTRGRERDCVGREHGYPWDCGLLESLTTTTERELVSEPNIYPAAAITPPFLQAEANHKDANFDNGHLSTILGELERLEQQEQ